MAIIKSLECGFQGCKKGKYRPHTHMVGMEIMGVSASDVQRAKEYAQMRGEKPHIPGGSPEDMRIYVRDAVAAGNREAAEFRKRISQEFEEMKRNKKEKPDQKVAEQRARAYMKKKFKWK